VKDLADRAKGYGIHAVTVDGNDVLAVYAAAKHAVERARRGKGVHFVEVKTYRRKGHAEHDDQSYQPPAEREWWAKENDPLDRYAKQLLETGWAEEPELADLDRTVKDEVDQATDACVNDPLPAPQTALPGVYAQPAAAERLWFRML
jgi:TPP-dependent pyruvate/acetoin dehydrogenase alpha subunit